jgi:hypothetical protein
MLTQTTGEQLMAALRERARQQTIGAFVEHLGISRAYWFRIRNGSRPLTDRFVRRIREAYPELEPLCNEALLNGVSGRAA